MLSKNDALIKLEKDIEMRRYSQATVKRYTYIAGKFLDYMNDSKPIEELDEYDVINYLNYLTKERNYKASTYNNVNAILKFFLVVTLEKNISDRRLPNAKVEFRLKCIPTKAQIERIIADESNLKRKCWYSLAYGSGLRTCEVASLKVKDIRPDNMKVVVIGKGNKERITLLSEKTLKLLRLYCKEYGIKRGDTFLFPGQSKEHISESTISRSLSKIVLELGIEDKITMHSFRRSFITHLLDMGVDIKTVSELAGHASLSTTGGYARVVRMESKIKNPLDCELYEIYN